MAERLRGAFRDKLADLAEIGLQPTLSIGVAEAELGGRELDDLLVEADEALYRAKRLGRDRVQAQLKPAA